METKPENEKLKKSLEAIINALNSQFFDALTGNKIRNNNYKKLPRPKVYNYNKQSSIQWILIFNNPKLTFIISPMRIFCTSKQEGLRTPINSKHLEYVKFILQYNIINFPALKLNICSKFFDFRHSALLRGDFARCSSITWTGWDWSQDTCQQMEHWLFPILVLLVIVSYF